MYIKQRLNSSVSFCCKYFSHFFKYVFVFCFVLIWGVILISFIFKYCVNKLQWLRLRKDKNNWYFLMYLNVHDTGESWYIKFKENSSKLLLYDRWSITSFIVLVSVLYWEICRYIFLKLQNMYYGMKMLWIYFIRSNFTLGTWILLYWI